MKQIDINEVMVGDYIHIIPIDKTVRIVKIGDAYNSIDDDGIYGTYYKENIPDTSVKDLKEYIASWCYTWYDGEIEFFRGSK